MSVPTPSQLIARAPSAGPISRAGIDPKDFYKLAYELCVAYRQIGAQIVSNMNVTLKSLLGFEREISAFNRRLQAGLSEVQCCERVRMGHRRLVRILAPAANEVGHT